MSSIRSPLTWMRDVYILRFNFVWSYLDHMRSRGNVVVIDPGEGMGDGQNSGHPPNWNIFWRLYRGMSGTYGNGLNEIF